MTGSGDRSDVLVVGGGSAGCVVAARLAEDPGRSVTLVEAGSSGGDPGPLGILPVGPGSGTVTRHGAVLRGGAEVELARGRGLGGSGAVNGGYFVRATADDFAGWPASWSYGAVLPWFRRSETDPFGDRAWHGDDGPMPVTRVAPDARHPISGAFVDAAVAAGFGYRADLNEPDASGVGPVPLNARGGLRVGTAAAYLGPRGGRPNLRVVTRTRAVRLVVEGGRVIGVQVRADGRSRVLRAGTVVLAAGAVGTPHLLMLSGIGPAQHLSRLGVPVVVDRPGVGRGAHDHPEVTVAYRPLRDAEHRDDRPILEVVLETDSAELRPYAVPFGRSIPGVDDPYGRIGVALMRPRSRGEVVVRSADPDRAPLVRYGYLRDAADRVELLAAVDLARALLTDRGFAGLAEPMAEPADPLAALGTSMHLAGSCAMGSADDPLAVVDERCRVLGVDGLWIADGSVMPSVPSRGPHATVVMIGERVAAFVADSGA